jgi:hypothetical protein
MFTLRPTRTFRILSLRLPPELVQYILEFWIGPLQQQTSVHTLAYQFGRCGFPEGIRWCIRTYPSDTLVLNQILYGSATRSDTPMSLHLLDHGATDLETAVSLALERGYVSYVRQLLYSCDKPLTPLSISSWARFCKSKKETE